MEDPSPGIDDATSNDNYIMEEVKKIEAWKLEGHDTKLLEELLFEDPARYQQEKVKFISDRSVENTQYEEGTYLEQHSKQSDQLNHNDIKDGEIEHENLTEPHLRYADPPLSKQNMAFHKKNEPGLGKRVLLNRKGRSITVLFLSLLVISIVTSTSFLLYREMKENESNTGGLDPSFTISDLAPTSGKPVSFLSLDEYKGVLHQWTIFPESYSIISGSLTAPELTVFFQNSGRYRIEHTVSKGDSEYQEEKDLSIDPLSIRIEKEKVGDHQTMEVRGRIEIGNVRTLIDIPEASTFRSLEMDMSSKLGRPTSVTVIEGPNDIRNGLGETYSNIQRITENNLDIIGTIKKYDGTMIPFDGDITSSESTYIDRHYKRQSRIDVQNSMMVDVQLQAGNTKRFIKNEEYSMFPDMLSASHDLSLEDVANDRNLREGEFGSLIWGNSVVQWKAEGAARSGDLFGLNISMWMEQSTLAKNDLELFKMNMLLVDDHPVSVLTVLHVDTFDQIENPYVLDITQELVSFEPGNTPIIYGTIESYHDDISRIEDLHQDMSSDFHTNWTYAPIFGKRTSSIPKDFSAEMAIESFVDKPGFNDFIGGLDDPYSVVSNYTEISGDPTWKFSITEPGEEFAWNQTVKKGSTINPGFKAKADFISISKDDIRRILTASGAEHALKILIGDMDGDLSKELYASSKPGPDNMLDLEETIILFISDHSYPNVGLMNIGLFDNIPYAMVVTLSDGSIEVSIDLINGQINYIYRSV